MANFNDFLDRLKLALESLLVFPVTESTKGQLNSILTVCFRESEVLGEILMPFDGMRITGGTCHFQESCLCIRWITDFFPSPRFSRPSGDCQALGFFGEYDLYIGNQGPLPPTLIAKYGDGPGCYTTFNPSLMGIANSINHGEHFSEAMRRAMFINYELDW